MTIDEELCSADHLAFVMEGKVLVSQCSARASRKLRPHAEGRAEQQTRPVAHVLCVDEWDNWKSVRDVG